MSDEASEDEIDELIGDIEDLVKWGKSQPTDWDYYPYDIRRLVRVWHDAESDVAALQQGRIQAFIKSWFKEQ